MKVLLAAGLTFAMAVTAAGQDVSLLVLPFEGPDDLGTRTAGALALQLRQGLRTAPAPGRQVGGIGTGAVDYTPERTRPVRNHIDAERSAGATTDLVLWGRTQPYGNSTVVRAYLSLPRAKSPDHPGSAIWKIALPGGDGISVGIPAWRYEFEPVVLRPGTLPELRAAVDFTGALIRVFRGDWSGSLALFDRVVASPSAPAIVKAYALLLMGAASEQLAQQTGQPSRAVEYVDRSYRLNPYLQATIRYKCMAHLADMARSRSARRALAETVARNDYLFSSTDRWIGKVKGVLAR